MPPKVRRAKLAGRGPPPSASNPPPPSPPRSASNHLPPSFTLNRDSRVMTDFPSYEDMSRSGSPGKGQSFLQSLTGAAASGAQMVAGGGNGGGGAGGAAASGNPRDAGGAERRAGLFGILKPIRSRGSAASGGGYGAAPSSSDASVPESPSISSHHNHLITPTSSKPCLPPGYLATGSLVLLTLSFAGAQAAWTVELGYGTPYLLSLGLSKELTSLVWLAGPLSGLIVQPLIGSLSDAGSGRWKRRKYIIGSGVVVAGAGLTLAFCEPLGRFLAACFGSSSDGDWDPRNPTLNQSAAIGVAVAAFYVLDFALNALQATCRALILDRAPAGQQNVANAWHGRQVHVGNIVGYGLGWTDLGRWRGLSWVGGGQFRKLCLIVVVLLAASLAITCATQPEGQDEPEDDGFRGESTRQGSRSRLRQLVEGIYTTITRLPESIKRVCYVQLVAWCAWFPLLFYASTYVAEATTLDARRAGRALDPETATRAGSSALLLYSIVAMAAGAALPWLTSLGRTGYIRTRRGGGGWKWVRKTLAVITARNVWTASLVFFSVLICITFATDTGRGASVIVALTGIPWAVACWVPFALIMEYIREENAAAAEPAPQSGRASPSWKLAHSAQGGRAQVGRAVDECAPLLEGQREGDEQLKGGTILGIHNLSIVLPQLVVSLIASLIFRILDATTPKANPPLAPSGALDIFSGAAAPEKDLSGRNDVVWVLRFGGLAALFAAVVSRWVIPPPTELDYWDELKWQMYREEAGEGASEQEE